MQRIPVSPAKRFVSSFGMAVLVRRQNQNGAKVVDVGQCGAGLDQVPKGGEEAVTVIIGKVRFGVQAA